MVFLGNVTQKGKNVSFGLAILNRLLRTLDGKVGLFFAFNICGSHMNEYIRVPIENNSFVAS